MNGEGGQNSWDEQAAGKPFDVSAELGSPEPGDERLALEVCLLDWPRL